MKTITLNSPAVRNNGDYIDAGTIVDVGTSKTAIDADRAKSLVDCGMAVAVTAAQAKSDKVAE